VSGWLQKWLDHGVQPEIEILPSGLTVLPGISWPAPLWLRVYSAITFGGYQVAVEGRLSPLFTNQMLYGQAIGEFPLEVPLYYDSHTQALDTFPPVFAEGSTTTQAMTLTIQSAPNAGSDPFHLEWWNNMLSDFGQRVVAQLEGASWTNAPEEPDAVLLLVGDREEQLDREDSKVELDTALITVADLQELDADPPFQGGFGRKARKLTCLIHVFVKNVAGVEDQEDSGLKSCTLYLEDIVAELDPPGSPNRLDGYLVHGQITAGQKPTPVKISGTDLVHATLRFTGHKFQVA